MKNVNCFSRMLLKLCLGSKIGSRGLRSRGLGGDLSQPGFMAASREHCWGRLDAEDQRDRGQSECRCRWEQLTRVGVWSHGAGRISGDVTPLWQRTPVLLFLFFSFFLFFPHLGKSCNETSPWNSKIDCVTTAFKGRKGKKIKLLDGVL